MPTDGAGAQGRFFYLAPFGIAVTAGLLHSDGARLGTALQHAVLLVLIFLGLLLVYGLTNELASQLFPDMAAPGGHDRVVLRRAAGGHFNARATLNGAETGS